MDSASLRAISFFQKLTDSELQTIAALFETRDYKRGDRILEEGTVPHAFYVVREGMVHVRGRANDREMLLARLGPGTPFGEINLFDPGVATASIYAMKDSRIASIPYVDFLAYMEKHPGAGYRIACGILVQMAQRMRTTSARLVKAVYREIPAGPGVAESENAGPRKTETGAK